MEALDKYLEAVRGYLPRAQRADIVAELAEDLRSEIEERQAIVVGVILALAVAGYVIFSGPARAAAPALSGVGIWVWFFAGCSLAYVGLFTLIFAFVEHRQRRAHATGQWDPRDPEGLSADVEAAARRSARANAVAEVVIDLVVLSWWLGVHLPGVVQQARRAFGRGPQVKA